MKKLVIFIFLVIALIIGLALATRLYSQNTNYPSFQLSSSHGSCLLYLTYEGMTTKVIFNFNNHSKRQHYATAGQLINLFQQYGFKPIAEPPDNCFLEIYIRQRPLKLPAPSSDSPLKFMDIAPGYDLINCCITSPFKDYSLDPFLLKTSNFRFLDYLVSTIIRLINIHFKNC